MAPLRVLLAASLAFAASCGSCEPEPDEPPVIAPEPPDPEVLARGREVYLHYCALCHGEDGEGYAADNANALNNQHFLRVADDEFLRTAIAEGRPGTPMSAWSRLRGGPLSGGDIHKLVAYIRSWQTEPSVELSDARVEGQPARATQAWQTHCQSCHGARGEGVTAIGIANPRFLASASDAYIDHAIRHGRPPTPMPAFEAELPEQTIHDLVALIRSWARPLSDQDPVRPDIEIDWDAAVINPEGEAPRFTLREDRYVSAAQVKDALDQGRRIILLDARATSDYLTGHITGAIPVPFYDIEPMIEALPRDGTHIVAYCACPHAASGRVVDTLRRREFENTSVLDEGVHFWEEQGYPMSTGPSP